METFDSAEYARWLQAADQTVAAARTLADDGRHNWACFMAEQAAQFALKGLLHAVGAGRHARTHDLLGLAANATDAAGARIPDLVMEALRRLARHYQTTRYPDALAAGTPSDHYGPSDSRDAISDAKSVAAFVAAAWESLAQAAQDATHEPPQGWP